MKTIHAILALAIAALFISVFSFASEEPATERQVKIKIADGDDMVAIEADDVEVGETRQFYTESGKEVLLTRTEEGFDLKVDGKDIDLDLAHGEGHHAKLIMRSGDGEDSKVMIHTLGGEGAHGYAFIHAAGEGDDDGVHHWVQKGEDGDSVDIRIERISPADHLLQSGVLDDLDAETRDKILSTLREAEPHVKVHKRVVVKVEEEEK